MISISILKWLIIKEGAKGKLKKQILENPSGKYLLKLSDTETCLS